MTVTKSSWPATDSNPSLPWCKRRQTIVKPSHRGPHITMQPPAGRQGTQRRASGRQTRGIRSRRTGRHTRNYQPITKQLYTPSPSKRLTLHYYPPLPQPNASTTTTLSFRPPPPPYHTPTATSC